jgi:hypothetical protein
MNSENEVVGDSGSGSDWGSRRSLTGAGDDVTLARMPRVRTKTSAKTPKAAATDKPRTRLRRAFRALNERGIVALENAGYTMSDGWEDVNEIARKLADAGHKPRGGAFYHGQDRDRAKRGEGVSIAFGSYVEGKGHERASLAIAKEIVAVLEEHGFSPAWNGKLDRRIHTGRFEWV